MRSLTMEEYSKIIRNMDFKFVRTQAVELMKQWDEIRTDINPNAKWYEIKEEKDDGYWEKSILKDLYICSKCRESFRIPTTKRKPKWGYCPNCGQKKIKE